MPAHNITLNYQGRLHNIVGFEGSGFVHPWQFGIKPKPYGHSEVGFVARYAVAETELVLVELQTTDYIDRFPHINRIRPYFDFSDMKFLRVKLAKYDLHETPLPVSFTGRLLLVVPNAYALGNKQTQRSEDHPAWEMQFTSGVLQSATDVPHEQLNDITATLETDYMAGVDFVPSPLQEANYALHTALSRAYRYTRRKTFRLWYPLAQLKQQIEYKRRLRKDPFLADLVQRKRVKQDAEDK